MKKILPIVLVLVLALSSASFAANSVKVKIPNYNVSVNNQAIDIEHSKYPVIEYKNITYFPMTFDYLEGIGLELNYSAEEGLVINKSQASGTLTQSFLGENNVLGSTHSASIANYPVKVNGALIDNSKEEYPVLMYQNITYFPMTWRFAVTEFGWTTAWSDAEGFGINVDGSQVSTGTVYSDGLYKVGTDIQPGLYKVTHVKDIFMAGYVDKHSDNSLSYESKTASRLYMGDGYLRIKETDSYINVVGLDLDSSPIKEDIKTTIEEGMYIVGKDIEPGTYKLEIVLSEYEGGLFERLSDVSLETEDIIESKFYEEATTVEVKASDYAISIAGAKLIKE